MMDEILFWAANQGDILMDQGINQGGGMAWFPLGVFFIGFCCLLGICMRGCL